MMSTNVDYEGELEQMLKEFNCTNIPYPADQTIISLFERQVAKTPDRIAVVFEGCSLTYAKLNAKANSLGRKLRDLGVQPNDFVAILADRGVEMVIGIYGVLKAGAAYVPMDPAYPQDRIQYMLEDCAPKAVLSYNANLSTELPVIDLGGDLSGEVENLPKTSKPEDLAYLIYTSGTTGRPKGVMIENRNVVNYCSQKGYGVFRYAKERYESILSVTNIVFDIFVTEAILPLLHGMCVVIANEEEQTDAEAFARLQNVCKAQVLQTTPSRLQMFLAQDPKCSALRHFKYIMIGGEKVSAQLVQRLRGINPDARIIDVYGPSETTVWSTCADVTDGDISIGKPISNTQIYILRDVVPCRIGEQGELCIAGAGLARGYLNLPELTEEKFIKNPFGEGRLYRTGDLAKWLPDGRLEFLGRKDEQVKLRGYRIELQEIESVLREIETVKDCAVITREVHGEIAIHAYLVSEGQADLSEIRAAMSLALPEYMIPAYIMQIEAIPVNRNGKLDKRALPEITEERAYTAPRDETEKKICDLFSELLYVERVGIHDDFFELGGHSLKAAQLINRIEISFGCKLTPKDIFANSKPERLAAFVAMQKSDISVSIPMAEKKAYYPVSSAQLRMYVMCQMDESSVAYNLPEFFHLTGVVSPDGIKVALQRMIERHEILRTVFQFVDGKLMQRILPSAQADFVYIEDMYTSETELMKAFVRPFDLAKAPLLRVKLIKRESGYLLMMDTHHIVSDGISAEIFRKEFAALYNGKELSVQTHQYKDYSEWMRSRDLSAQKEYWLQQFCDEPPVLDLALDFARPQVQSYRGEGVLQVVEMELGSKIRELSRQSGATEYMIFLSAAMVLLSKYGRQEDIVIGSAFGGRTHRDTEGMLGMFVNTLALRGYPVSRKTYKTFLSEIRDLCLKAHENQEYSFNDLIDAIGYQRDAARNPLFDVMLVMQNNEQMPFCLDGVEAQWVQMAAAVSKFDLTFNIEERNGQFVVNLEYCTDLFKKDSAERILQHYLAVLTQLTENCEQLLSDIKVLTPAEECQILDDFNDTDADYPRNKTIVELFEEQVVKTPMRTAVSCEDRQLTYLELNERANQLARKLRNMGVKQNDFVAIFAERGVEVIVGIYGVLKAGAAYVPIDPTYPSERIRFMIEDCKPKAILTYQTVMSGAVPIIDLGDAYTWSEETENVACVNNPSDLAYCIYTSGTTGKPKGVLVEHHGVSNLKAYFADKFQVTEVDRVLQFANYVFDASVWEINMALLNGAELIISTNNLDISLFEKDFRDRGVTIATLPPNFYARLGDICPRLLITAGSASDRGVLEKAKGIRYINAYGPTEFTVAATHWEREGDPWVVPIGKPIPNTKVYILQGTALCGIGVPGELCISGVGMARGYLNQPELTAEKFIENPFGEGKLYRTGDLARWMPDGNIEFLGRIDDQVKVRGFRVELGEVESTLRAVEGVKDCAIIVRKDTYGENAICAYVVSDIQVEFDAIRATLRKSLPDYMIPTYLMQLEHIPVTRNGKLDRHALPEIEVGGVREYIPARNTIEQIVSEAFCEILGVASISVKDSFFELGGDSIKAIRVVSKVREKGYSLTVRDIMGNATIENIALCAVPMAQNTYVQTEVTGKIPSTPMLEQFARWNLAKPQHFNQAVMLPVNAEEQQIRHALNAIVKHHDILRAVYYDGQLEILSDEESEKYEFRIFDLREREDASAYIEAKCTQIQASIELSVGPLLKAALFQCRAEQGLLLCIHHLVIDSVSWHILLEDFHTAIRQQREGKTIRLPYKTASFKDWAEALNEYKRSEMLRAEIPYWEKVSGQIPCSSLRLEREHSEKSVHAMVKFSEAETDALLHEAGNAYNTQVHDLLLAALSMAIWEMSGQKTIAVCLEGHGREKIHKKIDIDRTVGWFTSAYPVILECTDDVESAVINTKEMLRKIPNHGLGYALLPQRKGIALTDVYFNYLGESKEIQGNVGMCIAEENRFGGEVNFNGGVTDGIMIFNISCNYATFSEKTARYIAECFKEKLLQVIDFCVHCQDTQKTHADVDADDMDEDDFAEINAILGLL